MSVPPSVTHWHCVKMTQAKITKSSRLFTYRWLKDSSIADNKVHPQIRKGSLPAGALNESELVNFAIIFSQ